MVLNVKKIFRIYLVALVLLVFISCGRDKKTDRDVSIPPYLTDYSDLYLEDPRKANLEWFKNAKYGLFMHYGVYSSLEDGAWVQLRHDPPIAVADDDTS